MKITKENLQLSGKGAIITNELLNENIKIVTQETQLHEVVTVQDDQTTRIGWIVPNTFDLFADFTTHTKNGMVGKSIEDKVERALIFDTKGVFDEILPDSLIDVDTTESAKILEEMFKGNENHFRGDFNIDHFEQKDGLIIISPRSKLLFVQTEKSSIRLSSNDGVYVLNREGSEEKLITIGKEDGINIWGDKNISIHGKAGNISINGKPLNIGKIISGALGSIGPAIAGLGAFGNFGRNFNFNFDPDVDTDFDFDDLEDFHVNMEHFEHKMEKLGEKMSKMGEKFAKSFGKNFAKNFSVDFNDDFDTDFSDAHDVDVDF